MSTAPLFRYEALEHKRDTWLGGVVSKISRTAVPAQGLPFPAAPSDIYYIVTVQPSLQHVLAYGKQEALQSGMQLEADIWLERRTLLEWIFEPLYSITGRLP